MISGLHGADGRFHGSERDGDGRTFTRWLKIAIVILFLASCSIHAGTVQQYLANGQVVGTGNLNWTTADATASVLFSPSTSTMKGLVLQAKAGQSAHMFEVTDSTGSANSLFQIRSNGSTYIQQTIILESQITWLGQSLGIGPFATGVIKTTDGTSGIRALSGGGADVASAVTLPLPTGSFFHVTGTTAFTTITSTNFQAGAEITMIFDGVIALTSTANVVLRAAYTTAANNTLSMVFDGANWYETGRGAVVSSLTGTTQSGTPFLTVLGSSGLNSASGVGNTGIGYNAGNAMTTGTGGTFAGYQAGLINTANSNTFIGVNSGNSNTSGTGQCFVGASTGLLVTGSDNSIFGNSAGDAFTTGARNSIFGKDAGGAAGAAGMSDTVMFGYQAGLLNTASSNTMIGSSAGAANVAGINVTYIGFEAGKIATGNQNLCIGYQSGVGLTTGTRNTLVGNFTNTSLGGNNNTFLGYTLGTSAGATSSQNVAIGAFAYQDNSAGIENVIIGASASDSADSGSKNVIIGALALTDTNAAGPSEVVVIGYGAARTNTAINNVFIGSNSGAANTSGTGQCFAGYNSGLLVTGSNNTIFGNAAGDAFTTGTNNTFIGKDSGGAAGATAITACTFVGYQSGVLTTGNQNTAIGSVSLAANTSGTNQTGVGYGALNVTTGSSNTGIGSLAGSTLTTGADNTFLGYLADTSLVSVASSIAIGRGATTTASNQMVIGANTFQVTDIYLSEGVTNASALAWTANGTGGSGSDNAGADAILAGGKGTGAAASGYVGIKYPLLTTTGSTLQTLSTLVNRPFGMIYVSTANVTLTGSTATTGTIIGAQTNAVPQGTLTLDAQLLRVGTTIRIKAYGIMTQSAAGPTLTVEGKLGSTVISTATIPASAGGVTDAGVNFETTLVCRSTGAGGTVQGDGRVDVQLVVASGTNSYFPMYKAVTTVDTTGALAIDLFATWSANTAGNAITITNVTVEFR